MSQKNRNRRQSNARRRAALGLDQSLVPRGVRRDLERKMKTVPVLEDVQADLARFSPGAVMDLLTEHPRQDPPFLIARLVRELAQLDGEGSQTPTEADLGRMLLDLANLADPVLTRQVGGNFAELVLTRLLASQLQTQRDFVTDFPRVLSVLADPDADSLVGPNEWTRLLGVDLAHFLLGVDVLVGALERGPLDLDTYLAIDGEGELNDCVRAVVAKLAGDLAALQRAAAGQSGRKVQDRLYEPGPLLALPLYWRSDGRLSAPAVDYLRLASSPPALYIRLIRADNHAKERRARSGFIGNRFGAHLMAYAAGGAGPGWQVRDLDQEPPPGTEIADIAIWPENRTFLLIVEGKATLQLFDAQLGSRDSRQKVACLYQKSFDQIDATVSSIGQRGFLADAPTDVPTFGLTVTLDLHLTTVINNATHVGIVLDYRQPQGPTAGSVTPCRVLEAGDFEVIADLLGWAHPEQVKAVLDGVFAESRPVRTARLHISKKLGEIPQDAPINPLVLAAFQRLGESVVDPVIAEQLRSVSASLAR